MKKLTALMLAMVSGTGCVTELDALDESDLQIVSANDEGLVATMVIGGDLVSIESRLTTREVPALADADDGGEPSIVTLTENVRVATLRSEDGTLLATYVVNADDGEVSGRFGEYDFGGAADDAAAPWKEFLESPTGAAVLAVAEAAGEVDQEIADMAAQDLVHLGRMKNTLRTFAGEEVALQAAGSCHYGALSWGEFTWITQDCWSFHDTCRIETKTRMGKDFAKGCPTTYYVKQYDSAGILVASDSQSGLTVPYRNVLLEATRYTSQKHGVTVCRTNRWGDSTASSSAKYCHVVPESSSYLRKYWLLWDTWP